MIGGGNASLSHLLQTSQSGGGDLVFCPYDSRDFYCCGATPSFPHLLPISTLPPNVHTQRQCLFRSTSVLMELKRFTGLDQTRDQEAESEQRQGRRGGGVHRGRMEKGWGWGVEERAVSYAPFISWFCCSISGDGNPGEIL